MKLCPFLRFRKCSKFLNSIESVNNLDGSQNIGWLKIGTFEGYRQMAELLVKIPYTVF